MKRYISILLILCLLAGCGAEVGAPGSSRPTPESPIPTAETTFAPGSAAETPAVGLTPAPEPDWEGMLAHLEPGDIRGILRDILNDSITPESLAPLIREAMAHPVEHRQRENGDDTVWDINLTLGSGWQDGNVTLYAGLEEDLVGVSLPGKTLWLEDGDLYRLVRTSMDTPPDIDQAAYEKFGDYIQAYYDRDLARRNEAAGEPLPGNPGWTSSGWELDVLRLAAEREDLGLQAYDLRIVNYVDPPELAPHRVAGGAYVDSRLAIHGWDWKSTYLAVADGEPAGVFYLSGELDMSGFATRQEFLDMVAEESVAGG